jgi:hypothetical protein
MYPHTQNNFEINGIQYHLKAPTLLFKSQLEDTNQNITYSEILRECTNIDESVQNMLPPEEIEKICEDAMTVGMDTDAPKGEGKSAAQLIAILLNRGHTNPGAYRLDFAKIIFEEYSVNG